MIQPTTSTNIRIKKSFPMQSKYLKSSAGSIGMMQTRYSQPFGKFFIDKNKDRITQPQTNTKSKYSQRYIININKLQKINDKQYLRDKQQYIKQQYIKQQAKRDKQKMQLNRTLSNSTNHQQFNITSPMFKYNSTSQSHRSHVMTVNLKQLPKLSTSSNFNGSHNKIESLKQQINQFGLEVINLVTKTRDFKITFDRTKINLENHCEQVQRNLNGKINQLQKFIKNTTNSNKQRSQTLNNDCNNLKQKNLQLKGYLQLIQSKIQGIQNVLGVTTAHHKHYV